MKKGILFSFIFILFIGLYSYNYNPKITTRTLMIYMNGSDLETENKIASSDLAELMNARVPKGMTVLVKTGGTKKWHNKSISENHNQIFEIKNGKLKLLKTMPKQSMGDSRTLSGFIDFSLNYKESKENILVLWNHGGGAIVGFGKDENFKSDTLLLDELKKGFKTSYEHTKKKLDLVVFDACLMSSLETANSIKDYSKYMVASEELVLGYGFDYKKIVNNFNNRNLENIGKVFVDTYYNESKNKKKDNLVTMSFLDLNNVGKLYNNFNEKLKENDIKKNTPNLNSKMLNAITFGGRTKEEGFSNMVDLGALSKNLFSQKDNEDINKDINKVVVYNKNGYINKDACGLSVYFPVNYNNKAIYELKLYNYLSLDNEYYKFLKKYVDNENIKKVSHLYDIKKVSGKNIIYEIKLNDEKKNKPFYLDNNILSVKKISTKGKINVYTAPIIYNDKEASLRFEQETATGKINTEGVIMSRGTLNLSEKKVLSLKENDKVRVLNYEFLEDGEIKRIKGIELKVTANTSILQM